MRAAHPPYDGARLLWFLGQHAVPGLETWDGTTYARALRLPGGPGVVQLAATATGVDARLRLSDPADAPLARRGLAHLLDLSGDPASAETHLGRDAVLAPLVAQRPGLRVPGSVDHVETLVRTVIGQQISLAGARAVTGRIVAEHGQPLPQEVRSGGVTHAFPTRRAFARLDPASLPMPRARGAAVVGIAAAVLAAGEDLVDGTPERAAAVLALPGVGPWTASYQALRAARDPDVFLPTDLAVRRALEGHGLPGDARAAAERSLAWAPFRSTALLHLWTHLLEGRAR